MEITSTETADTLMAVLADDYSRRIMLAAAASSKSVESISKESNIPLSTCYRRINELLDAGALVVERVAEMPDGKLCEMVRSSFSAISATFGEGTLRVEVMLNEDSAGKLGRLWAAMKQPDDRSVLRVAVKPLTGGAEDQPMLVRG